MCILSLLPTAAIPASGISSGDRLPSPPRQLSFMINLIGKQQRKYKLYYK